jgi:hypothetical protein
LGIEGFSQLTACQLDCCEQKGNVRFFWAASPGQEGKLWQTFNPKKNDSKIMFLPWTCANQQAVVHSVRCVVLYSSWFLSGMEERETYCFLQSLESKENLR